MMTKEIVIERYGPRIHDGQRRLGGLDAAAPAPRTIRACSTASRPARSSRTTGPGAGVAGLPRTDALLLADEPAQSRPRVGAGQPAIPDSRHSAACLGLEPDQSGQPCGQKVLASAPTARARPWFERRLRTATAQVWNPTTNPTGERCGIADFMRAIFGVTRTPDAPNGKGNRRPTMSACSTACVRCRAARSRPRSSSTSTATSAAWTSTATSLQRTSADLDALADRLRDRPSQQRHRRGEPPRDRQPHRSPDGRHGLPPGVPLVQLPRAARSLQRQPRQPGHLAVSHRRHRAEPVRRHAQVARHSPRPQHPAGAAPSRPRPTTPASWPTA